MSRTESGSLRSASPACWVFRPQDVAARRTRFLLPPHSQQTAWLRCRNLWLAPAINICFVVGKVARTGGVLLLVKSLLFSHRCRSLGRFIKLLNGTNCDQSLTLTKHNAGLDLYVLDCFTNIYTFSLFILISRILSHVAVSFRSKEWKQLLSADKQNVILVGNLPQKKGI